MTNTQTHLDAVKAAIRSSDLSEFEQQEFIEFLSRASDEELEPFAVIFSEESKFIRELYNNYQKKKNAIGSESAIDWQDIISDEEALLAGI